MTPFKLSLPLILVATLLISTILMAPLEQQQQENENRNQTEQDHQVVATGEVGEGNNSEVDESSYTDSLDPSSFKNTSTFTCYGKVTGYYADVKLGCRVYHFCTELESINGETTYQRMSYICLENSIFDQKDLNCVRESELRVSCDKAEQEYDSSNKQFDSRDDDSQPSMSDNLAANLMMNPFTRFIAG